MKTFYVLILALVSGFCVAAEPTWNPADAVKEAEQDIRTGHIKFYWSGSIASMPIGVPIEVAKKYPQANVELVVLPTIYHFENDRKNTRAAITRGCLPTSVRSIDA
jgi:hypothetical protein